MEEDGSFEILGSIRGGGGPLSWEGVFMSVVCRKVSGWIGKLLAKTSSLKLGMGI